MQRAAGFLQGVLRQFRNYCGPIKIARCGFPWEKTTKRLIASPDFLLRSTGPEQRCATFFEESRMQSGSSKDLYRKSGFGLHQLRTAQAETRCIGTPGADFLGAPAPGVL
jgi:hypothetical protein